MLSTVDVTLDKLVAPLTGEQFINEVWTRDTLSRQGVLSQSDAIELLSRDSFEFVLSSLSATDSHTLRILRSGEARPVPRSRDQTVCLASVYRSYREGFTLSVSEIQRHVPIIAALRRNVEASLASAGITLARSVSALAYCAPPESKSFGPHYDNHEVIAIQCSGSKRWRVFNECEEEVAKPQRGASPRSLTQRLDLIMNPGDVLYLPRGVYHDTETARTGSLHITLSIYPATLKSLISQLSEQVSALARYLPRSIQSADSESSSARQLTASLMGLLSEGAISRALGQLRSEGLGRLEWQPADRLRQAELASAVRDATTLELRGDVAVTLRRGSDHTLEIHAGQTVLRMREEATEAVLMVLSRRPFIVHELPGVVRSDERVDLARALVAEGLCRVVQ